MIAPNLARWAREAKRKRKTPNLVYLRARDRQLLYSRIQRINRKIRHWSASPDLFIVVHPDWLDEALRPAVEALGRMTQALADLNSSGALDGFYVPPRSND